MIKPNHVLVLDTNKTPLTPCSPCMAKKLLKAGKAAVFRRFPFTIILKKRCSAVLGSQSVAGVPPVVGTGVVSPTRCCAKKVSHPSKNKLQLKIDPGSVTTGLALLDGSKVIWVAELNHRGFLIKKKLDSRRASRRLRRSRLRYRKPRFLNRTRHQGWLPPSLKHRVLTTMTWVKRLIKYCPIGSLAVELVRFDTQILQHPEIFGIEYQQGELAGYEVREYL